MTLAAALERRQRVMLGRHGPSVTKRMTIVVALIFADFFSFVLADLLLHAIDNPPALALIPARLSPPTNQVDLLALIAVIFVLARYVVGDYSRRQLFWDGAWHTTKAISICGLIYLAAVALMEPAGLGFACLVFGALFFVLPTSRQFARHMMTRAGIWQLPTAIIGTGPNAEEVLSVLGKQLALGLDVRWIVPENPDRHIPGALSKLQPILADSAKLAQALSVAGCLQVIFVPDERMQAAHSDLVDQIIGEDIRVAIVPSLHRLPLFGMSASYFFGRDLLLLQVRNNLLRLPQRAFKRTLDLIGALAALVLFSPLFALFSILIKRGDGGPVFFIQKRIGRGGREFPCWKFRTMVQDAEAQMARWVDDDPVLLERYRQSNFKLRSDPRVTRAGAWLRNTSLDELPQLINVLLGDMSLVGPRPLLRREMPDYGSTITLYQHVRPGITGLWQISGRSHTTFAERVSYDEWYIKNWTVWYDIVILLQTMWVLIRRDGAY